MIGGRRASDKKTWWQYYRSNIAAISATLVIVGSAYALYETKIRDPHVNKLIDVKQEAIYEKIKEANADLVREIKSVKEVASESARLQDKTYYMLLQHLSAKEKARANQEYRYYKDKETP